MIIESIYFIIGLLSTISTIKSWRENKNKILIAISIYLVAILIKSMIDVLIFLFDINLDVLVIGYVTIGQIIGNILFLIQVEFMFFLKKKKNSIHFPLLYHSI